MQIISGDENGIFKIIELEKQNVLLSKPILNGEDNKLVSMKENKTKNNIIVLSQKQLTIINQEFQILEQYDLQEPNALDFVIDDSGQQQKFVLFYQNFNVAHLQYDKKIKPLKVQQLNDNKKIKLNKIIQIDNLKVLLVFQGQPPSIYDIKTQQVTWKARNVANDIYDLQVKMDDYDGIKLDDYSIGVVTMHNTVRVYDITKPNQRPLFEYQIKEVKTAKLDQICLYKQYRVISTQKGEVFLYDKDFNFKKKLQGHGASIRQMLQIKDYLVTSCLDRYLRVYDDEKEITPLFSLNIKQRPQVFIPKQVDDNIHLEKVEKEKVQWNVQNGKQAKARFEGMRRHTIRLPYLQKMFENHRIRKIIQKKKQQILENRKNYENNQQVKEEYDVAIKKKIFKKKSIKGVQKVKGALLTNKKRNK